MNILTVAAECAPFAKIGGLADVASALPREWQDLGHGNIIVLPKYADIDVAKNGLIATDIILSVPMGHWREYARVWKAPLPDSQVTVYFLESADYFDRKGIYGNPDGFVDNDRRFCFLSRAAFELAIVLGFKTDVVHAHDYHTSLSLAFLKTHYRYHPLFASAAGVYTIHNMAFQGQSDPRRVLEFMGLPSSNFRGSWFEHDGVLNMMKCGLMFADKITTVSPTYANEIRWTSNGEGMQDYLNMRGADVIGVLNGADYHEWNPASDKLLSHQYTPDAMKGKALLKQELMEDSMPASEAAIDLPLIGMVTRLTAQKGISLLEESMEYLLQSGDLRFLILGSGDKRYENFLHRMGRRYPTRALIRTGYNSALSHQVIAASDFLMVPSLFEPCGLTQIYALKYGTVPIVRATGGLSDTVQEYNAHNGTGNGFRFDRYQATSFARAVRRAIHYYRSEPHWQTIRRNGMDCDYSARGSAEKYLLVFQWALEKRS